MGGKYEGNRHVRRFSCRFRVVCRGFFPPPQSFRSTGICCMFVEPLARRLLLSTCRELQRCRGNQTEAMAVGHVAISGPGVSFHTKEWLSAGLLRTRPMFMPRALQLCCCCHCGGNAAYCVALLTVFLNLQWPPCVTHVGFWHPCRF